MLHRFSTVSVSLLLASLTCLPGQASAQTMEPIGPCQPPATITPADTQAFSVKRAFGLGEGSIRFGNITQFTRDSYDGQGGSWYLPTPAVPTTSWISDTLWKWSEAEVHATCVEYQMTAGGTSWTHDQVHMADIIGGEAEVLQTRHDEAEDQCVYELGCDESPPNGGEDGGGGGTGGPQWLTCVYTTYTDADTGVEISRELQYCYYH